MTLNADTIAILGLVLAAVGIVVGIVFGVPQWIPVITEWRNRRILEDKFGRGPFDKATIERSTRHYIRPRCTNIDPAQEAELRNAVTVTADLFTEVDKFLTADDNTRRHLLILADSGTGKTSFVLNYYAYNARRQLPWKRRKRQRLALVPLGAKDANVRIKAIPDPQETVIFLDALDEDVKAISNHRERVDHLMNLCSHFKRVVMTCRTQFFPKDEEIPIETGIARLGPRAAGEQAGYKFWKLYLAPFDDEDVKRYIRMRYPVWKNVQRQRAMNIASKIPFLAVRPMLLAHIPEIVAKDVEIENTFQLYEVMVEAWLEREAYWTDKAALKEFSERLAVDLYRNREQRGMERIPSTALEGLAKEWQIDLRRWQVTGRSLLNRDAEGNYKFAHRSIINTFANAKLTK